MRIFRRDRVLCVRDSPECHQTSSLEKFRAGIWQEVLTRAALSLALTRAPVLSYPDLYLPRRFPTLTTSPDLFLCIFFSASFSLSFLKVAPRDRILSARLRTVDTYRSVLFTTQSILRDVGGVPISAVSALFYSLFAVPCLRIHILPSCFMRLSSLYIHSRCFPLLSRLDVVIVPDYCQKFSDFFFFHNTVNRNKINRKCPFTRDISLQIFDANIYETFLFRSLEKNLNLRSKRCEVI